MADELRAVPGFAMPPASVQEAINAHRAIQAVEEFAGRVAEAMGLDAEGIEDAQNWPVENLLPLVHSMRIDAQRWRAASASPAPSPDTERVNFLESWIAGDQTICPPGNHGGDVGNWMFAREDQARADSHGKWWDDWEGTTLREAIDAARSVSPAATPCEPTAQPKLESRVDLHRTATQPEKEGLAAGAASRLAEIERRLSAATPGPWEAAYYRGQCTLDHRHGLGECDYRVVRVEDSCEIHVAGKIATGEPYDEARIGATVVAGQVDYDHSGILRQEDAHFIAHSREDVAWLLSEVRRLSADAGRTDG